MDAENACNGRKANGSHLDNRRVNEFQSTCSIRYVHDPIIVGPNNSGKSRILKDLLELATKNEPKVVLLKDADFSLPDSFEELIEAYEIKDYRGFRKSFDLQSFKSTSLTFSI